MSHQVTRASFLYMEPSRNSYGKPSGFANCRTCMMWTGDKHETCAIHGKKLKVEGGDTCGLYVNGKPHTEMAGKEMPLVTTQESGFEKREVRCENCSHYDKKESYCELFEALNKKNPELFDLDIKVKAHGCCNANTPKTSAAHKRKYTKLNTMLS